MTHEEALKFFPDTDPDELEDAYEEQLFEYKKFFLSKAPIAKLFESRLRKLGKLGEAYGVLSLPSEDHQQGGNHATLSRGMLYPHGETIIELFQAFQKEKNELKRLISNATTAEALVQLVESLVALEKANASAWNTVLESEEDIIVSKEPDPMYLLGAIQAYLQQGGKTFQQLKNLENNPPELLIQEMKRLSLLFKKF